MQDAVFASMGPQRPLPSQQGEPKYLALVSGLGVGDEAADPQRLALVVDYLTGMLGDCREHTRISQVWDQKDAQKMNCGYCDQ